MPIQPKLCLCTKNNVTITCTNCGADLCGECDRIAHSLPALKTHQRHSYLGIGVSKYCTVKDHEGNILTLFCKDCTIPICGGVCAHIEHKGHNFVPLKTSVGEIKQSLESLLIPYQKEIKEIEEEIKRNQEKLKVTKSAAQELETLLSNSDKELGFLALVKESKVWQRMKTKIRPRFTWDLSKKGSMCALTNNNNTITKSEMDEFANGLVFGSQEFRGGDQYWEIRVNAMPSTDSSGLMMGVARSDSFVKSESFYLSANASFFGGSLYGTMGEQINGSSPSHQPNDTFGFSLTWDSTNSTYTLHIYKNGVFHTAGYRNIPIPIVPAAILHYKGLELTLNSDAAKPTI